MPWKAPTHKPHKQAARPKEKTDASRFRSSIAWTRLSRWFKRQHPMCQDCEREGRTTPATEVHHVVPVAVDQSKALEVSNLRALCRACHERAEACHSDLTKRGN